jgi:hypothetical protein
MSKWELFMHENLPKLTWKWIGIGLAVGFFTMGVGNIANSNRPIHTHQHHTYTLEIPGLTN